LDSSTVCNSLIRVDTTVGFLSIEEIFNELLNFRDTGRSTNKHDFVDFGFFETRIIQDSLDGSQSLLEKVSAELFETSTSDSLFKIVAINETFDFDLNLKD